MNIKDAAKAVEAKLEAEMKQLQSFTLPIWGWAAIGVVIGILVVVAFHG